MVTVKKRVGVHEPLDCTAVGKALLAFLPEAECERLIDRLTLVRYTARTIDSPAALRKELAEWRPRSRRRRLPSSRGGGEP